MEKKCFIKSMTLLIQTTTENIELTEEVLGEIKFRKLKNIYFEKKGPKVKNLKILHFITTFEYLALKIETG